MTIAGITVSCDQAGYVVSSKLAAQVPTKAVRQVNGRVAIQKVLNELM